MKPLISICIPTYKEVNFLKKTLDSIQSQTFKDFEIVITDDTRDDSVLNLLNDYNFQQRVIYKRNKQQLGSPLNWNIGLSLATGKFIKPLHHDDWFSNKNSLLKFANHIKNNSSKCFYFSYAAAVNENKNIYIENSPPTTELSRLNSDPFNLLSKNIIGPPSSIIFKNSNKYIFDVNLRWLVDIDFYINLLLKKNTIRCIPEVLIYSTTQEDHQITRQCNENTSIELRERIYLLNKYSSIIPFKVKKNLLIDIMRNSSKYHYKIPKDLNWSITTFALKFSFIFFYLINIIHNIFNKFIKNK